VLLEESDIVFSSPEGLEMVMRIARPGTMGLRVEAARIVLALNVEGEAESFVPFVLVLAAVEPVGGEFRPISPYLAREIIQAPGTGLPIRVDVSGLVRHWPGTGRELYLKLTVDEPTDSGRSAESIQVAISEGLVGRLVVVTR
jgi:hypothetical protein